MSNSTHASFDDEARPTICHTSVHLSSGTQVEARVQPGAAYGPCVALDIGTYTDAAQVMVFIRDTDVLDLLISTLAEARAAYVAELMAATDIPKAG